MNAKSHDGTFAPSHVIARHTYAETLATLSSDCAQMTSEADDAHAEALADLHPQPGELFWIAAHTAWGGWRVIYYQPSELTRMLAVRLARLRRNPATVEIAVLRNTDFDQLNTAIRTFRTEHHITELHAA